MEFVSEFVLSKHNSSVNPLLHVSNCIWLRNQPCYENSYRWWILRQDPDLPIFFWKLKRRAKKQTTITFIVEPLGKYLVFNVKPLPKGKLPLYFLLSPSHFLFNSKIIILELLELMGPWIIFLIMKISGVLSHIKKLP